MRALTDEQVRERPIVPRKIQKRRRQFIMVPWTWVERLAGADGQTYRVALILGHFVPIHVSISPAPSALISKTAF
jgi:hypothetical protein